MASAPINVGGAGILIDPGGILNVVMSSEGRVVELLVEPGDDIEEGDVVARIAQVALQDEVAAARAELEDEGRTMRVPRAHSRRRE